MAIGTLATIGLGAAGVGSFLSSKSNKKAANSAANAQTQIAAQNNALAQNIYGQNRAALTPFMQTGTAASDQINALLGIGGANAQSGAFDRFRDASGYNFRFNEGVNALNGGFAGSGVLQSGARDKAAIEYGQNLASGELGNYMAYLGNQQGVGLAGASALAGVGNNYVNTVSANNQNAADAQSNAALIKGQNNPLANAIGLFGGGLFGMGG